jgi:hypothetical protein
MKTIRYKTHWSYIGSAVARRELLSDFVLDIFYLMEVHGIIPPIEVLNQVLQIGGNAGGMEPGTTWRPFMVDEDEYDELIDVLLTGDIQDMKQKHPYIRFHRITLDSELSKIKEYSSWIKGAYHKYSQ